MKNLIKLSVLGLFFISGCVKGERRHWVTCFDLNHRVMTYNEISAGNVYTFNLDGRFIIFFRNAETNEKRIIDLSKNDCGID